MLWLNNGWRLQKLSPAAKRSGRLRELTNIVDSLAKKGITDPKIIIKTVRRRAYQMASKPIADEYVTEIIRRFSK